MNIVEEEFSGDRGDWADLGRGYIRPHHLHEIVEHQTKGQLKDRALWGATNQGLERKDFRDLLKYPLNTPASQIEI